MHQTQTIYLVRHGETDFNRNGIVQGSGVDSSLNVIGQAQAQAFFEHFEEEDFQHIFLSSLKRTKETMQPFIRQGLSFTQHPELNEMNWGDHEGQVGTPATRLQYQKMIQQWQAGNLNARLQNAESGQDLINRLSVFLNLLYAQSPAQYLICSHGRAMRGLLCLMLGLSPTQMDDFKPQNTGLFVLERSMDDNHYQLKIQNSTAHLASLNV